MFRDQLVAELPRLRRLCQRLAPPGVDPQDLAQDGLERAWRARDRFRADSRLSTWLHRIVVNRAIELGTSTRRESVELDHLSEVDLLALEIGDPEAVVERARDAGQLRAAMSRLPTADRMVLALHDGEGWSAREIARTCGLSTEATHKRLQRGRFRLARELTADPTPSPTSPHCLRTRAAASDYLDGTLDELDRSHVESHLRDCERCPPLAQALIGLRAALEHGPVDSAIPVEVGHYLRHLTASD